ncbi:MAG TPA: PAAR domain-containing protein [Bryobacteraceae bacterium]|nr:PAAR domain-containing protein [Bryobacteraceae bacterium]
MADDTEQPDDDSSKSEGTSSSGSEASTGDGGGEKKKEEPEEEEAKDKLTYSREGAPALKVTYDSDKGWNLPEPEPERKVAYEHEWFSKEGYLAGVKGKKEGKFASGSAEIGVGFGSAKASSGLSYDLNEKEASLNVINAKVQISVVHTKLKGKFKLGAWISSLFSSDEPEEKPKEEPAKEGTEQQGQAGMAGMGALMAARVGDLTSHGSPLAPGIGSTNVFIGNMPAWRTEMDFHACPVVKGVIPDVGGVVLMGSPTVFINFMMACRIADMVVEIPGGPNAIAIGCPTVFIGGGGGGGGAAGGGGGDGGGGESKDKKKEGEGVTVDASGEGDLLTASAEANVGVVFNKEAIKATGKLGAMAAVAKGKIEGGITFPLPWGHSIRFGAGIGGSYLSAGADIHGDAGWTKEEGLHASWGAGLALGLGASTDFSIGIK